eukprot:3503130-Rhodomonas_salina.2
MSCGDPTPEGAPQKILESDTHLETRHAVPPICNTGLRSHSPKFFPSSATGTEVFRARVG